MSEVSQSRWTPGLVESDEYGVWIAWRSPGDVGAEDLLASEYGLAEGPQRALLLTQLAAENPGLPATLEASSVVVAPYRLSDAIAPELRARVATVHATLFTSYLEAQQSAQRLGELLDTRVYAETLTKRDALIDRLRSEHPDTRHSAWSLLCNPLGLHRRVSPVALVLAYVRVFRLSDAASELGAAILRQAAQLSAAGDTAPYRAGWHFGNVIALPEAADTVAPVSDDAMLRHLAIRALQAHSYGPPDGPFPTMAQNAWYHCALQLAEASGTTLAQKQTAIAADREAAIAASFT